MNQANDDKFVYNHLLKALGKIMVSPEEVDICKQLLAIGCTFEDIREARLRKSKNNLRYLQNIVCEVRDERLKREKERNEVDELPI